MLQSHRRFTAVPSQLTAEGDRKTFASYISNLLKIKDLLTKPDKNSSYQLHKLGRARPVMGTLQLHT